MLIISQKEIITGLKNSRRFILITKFKVIKHLSLGRQDITEDRFLD